MGFLSEWRDFHVVQKGTFRVIFVVVRLFFACGEGFFAMDAPPVAFDASEYRPDRVDFGELAPASRAANTIVFGVLLV